MKINWGYTLIEILVALAVFAILSSITASAMYHAFDTRARVNVQANQLNEVQLALALMTRDIEQAIDRPIHGDEMRVFPAFVGEPHYLEFSRAGIVNPMGIDARSTMARIAYRCMNKKLIRRSWGSLDTPSRNHYQDRIVLDHLDECKFSYLTHSRQRLSEWRDDAIQQNQKKEALPIAIQ